MDEVEGDNPGFSTRANRKTLSERRRRYVGSRITRLREHCGLTLEELSQRGGLLVGVMEDVESVGRGVTFECLIDIAKELEVDAADLVEGME